MAEQQTNWTPVIITGMLLFFAKDLFKNGGNGESKSDAEKLAKEKAEQNPLQAGAYTFPPRKKNYYRLVITPKKLTEAVDMIKDGIGVFMDDEAMVAAGIKTAETRPDVRAIVGLYKRRYRKDLREVLRKNLGKRERNRLYAYVYKLPNYKRYGYMS